MDDVSDQPNTHEEWQEWHAEQDRLAEQAAEEQYKLTGTWWINVYSITRHYGGPEEGGRWYNQGHPVASIPIKGKEEAEQASGYWKRKYPKTDRRYSSIGGVDHDVYIEPHYGKEWNDWQPYE